MQYIWRKVFTHKFSIRGVNSNGKFVFHYRLLILIARYIGTKIRIGSLKMEKESDKERV